MVYGDPQDRMQFGVPSVRLPLKTQDGQQIAANAAELA